MNDIRPARKTVSRASAPTPTQQKRSSKQQDVNNIQSFVSEHVQSETPVTKESDFFAYVKADKAVRSSRRGVSSKTVSEKRTLSSVRTTGRPDSDTETQTSVPQRETSYPPAKQHLPPLEWRRPGHASKKRSVGIWWVAAVAVAGFIIALMNAFAGAHVVLTPKQENTFIDGTFTAIRGGSDDEMSIGYEVMDTTVTDSIEIPATAEQESERRATGTIVIYNNYSTNEQRLVKKTRFEDGAGHVYRINESVVVPGMRTEGGQTVPGSVEVLVSADEPGEKYNIGLADFTLPGFKGSPQYEKVYARSKTPMTGGFIGMEKVASAEAIAEARAELETRILETLTANVRSQIPEGSIFAPYASQTTFTHHDPVPAENGDDVVLVADGTLHAVLFDGVELARFVARRSISSYDDADVYFSDPSQLSIALVPSSEEESVTAEDIARDAQSLTVSLGGTPHIVWSVDEKDVISAILGLPRKEFDEVMKTFASVGEAKASLHPFWKGEFPDVPEDISITYIIDGKEAKK